MGAGLERCNISAIPVPYVNPSSGFVGGHYAVAQASGAVTGTIAASAVFASFRWAPTNAALLAVLMRIKVGYNQLTVQNGSSPTFDAAAIMVRGFTVDYTVNSTAINLATVTKSNTMNSSTMVNSQLGANGPRIITTAAMSGQTGTLDAAPFAMAPLAVTTLTNSVGNADIRTLYEWTGLGQHPVVLSNNEGVALRFVTGFISSTSTATFFVQWEWVETSSF